MANIFSKEVAYVYGFRHIQNNKLNIGLKTPTGASKYTYITSVEDKEFWREYSKGNMELTILFAGSLDAAKTAEWFALQYGTKTFPGRF